MRECPRCGREVKGTSHAPSKTPFCQPCASTLANRKRWSGSGSWPQGPLHKRSKPRIKTHVTLPKIGPP